MCGIIRVRTATTNIDTLLIAVHTSIAMPDDNYTTHV